MSIDKNLQCPFVRRFAKDLKLYGTHGFYGGAQCRAPAVRTIARVSLVGQIP